MPLQVTGYYSKGPERIHTLAGVHTTEPLARDLTGWVTLAGATCVTHKLGALIIAAPDVLGPEHAIDPVDDARCVLKSFMDLMNGLYSPPIVNLALLQLGAEEQARRGQVKRN